MQIQKSRKSNFYFRGTILKQFGHFDTGYFACTQLQCLNQRFGKVLPVTKNYVLVMIIDRGEDICFYHFIIVNVHSALSAANIGIFMNSSSQKNCSFNSIKINHIKALIKTLLFTRCLTVSLTIFALTLTATATQNSFL